MTADAVQVAFPVDALVSYHYYRAERDMAAITASRRLRLIGDSGAFSAYSQGASISLGEYAAWCAQWRSQLYWVAALDVIGDPVATFRNWRTLRDKHSLETVPTLHAGADTRWLDAYVAEGVDFIGLGGMVGGSLRAFRWLVHTFRYARDAHPQVRFHGWGITHRKLVDALPFYSVDSSGALGQAYRFGTLRLFDPATTKHLQVKLDGNGVYRVAGLLRRTYGVAPSAVATSHPGNRAQLIQLAAASTQQWAAWLQRRHGHVSAPAWSVNPDSCQPASTPPGPLVHLVSASQPGRKHDDLHPLAEAGTRVHLAGNGFTHPTANSLYPLAHPDSVVDGRVAGTRVHLVSGTQQAPGRTDLDALAGPRVHLVDGSVTNLSAVART